MTPPPDERSERLRACLALADPGSQTLPEAACTAAREAIELARQLDRPEDAARAGARLCVQLQRLGRHAEVLATADPVLQAMAEPPLKHVLATERFELMRVFTLAACETAHFDRALDTAHGLVRLAGPQGDATLSLKAAFTLGVCFERMGDSWQAARVIGDALRDHGPLAPDQTQVLMQNALCAISIGQFHRLNGAAPEAEVQAVLARALDCGTQALQRLPDPHDPLQEVAICGNLGEILMYQGDRAGAHTLLQRAEKLVIERGYSAHGWRLRTSQAVWQLLEGDPAGALAGMTALIAEMGGQPPQQTAIRAHHAAYRACRALGRFDEALAHFETVERLERQRATLQLRAQSELFVTRTEAQHAQWQAKQARLDAQTQRTRAAEFAARAERDPLTGLGNRRHFDRRCAELMPALQRDSESVALVLIDVDHFKAVNDRHGHDIGDQVLRGLADLLRDNTRSRDVLARYGGEEFVIVLPGMDTAQARDACERLRERVASHAGFSTGVADLRVTISLGLVSGAGYDAAQLLKAADQALYRAKHDGRNRLRVAASSSGEQLVA